MEIYLDNAATTRPWPEVVSAVVAAMGDGFGNTSSLHRRGLDASRVVEEAEDAVRALVGSGRWRVVFTSGGSESGTTAVLGSVPRGKRDTVVTSTLEHAAVEEAAARVRDAGGRVVRIAGGAAGVMDPAEVAGAVDDRTALVSVTHVANELGTVQPVAEIAAAVRRRSDRCRVHVDAVQAAAQLERLEYPPEVDMVSLSAHKIHGPQGVGALLLRPDVRPRPLVCGGDQQDRIRPGTLNLPGIAGFGVAARELARRRSEAVARMGQLAAELLRGVFEGLGGVRVLGDEGRRAPGIAVLAVEGVRSQVLLNALEDRGVLASAGSACHSTRSKPSEALVGAGLGKGEGALRLSLSHDTTREEIDLAAAAIVDAVSRLRSGRSR